jgi:drug/metabolite transporter (DMT)-like permease
MKVWQKVQSLQLHIHFLLLVANFCFSASYVVSKYPLSIIHSVHFATLRTAIALICLFFFWLYWDRNFIFEYRKEVITTNIFKKWIITKTPNKSDTLVLFTAGFMIVTINITFFVTGLHFTSPVVAAVFQPLSVIFTAAISSLILRTEKISLLKVFGIIVAVIGALSLVFITSATKQEGDASESTIFGIEVSMNSLIGAIFFILNCLGFAIGLNLQGIALQKRNIPPVTVTLWTFIWGLITNIPVCVIFYNGSDFLNTDEYVWLGVLCAGTIGCALPFVINSVAIKDLSPLMASAYETTIPIFSLILALIISQKEVNWWAMLAASVVLVGVFLVGYAKYKEQRPTTPIKIPVIDNTTELEQVTCQIEQDLLEKPSEKEHDFETDTAGPISDKH